MSGVAERVEQRVGLREGEVVVVWEREGVCEETREREGRSEGEGVCEETRVGEGRGEALWEREGAEVEDWVAVGEREREGEGEVVVEGARVREGAGLAVAAWVKELSAEVVREANAGEGQRAGERRSRRR